MTLLLCRWAQREVLHELVAAYEPTSDRPAHTRCCARPVPFPVLNLQPPHPGTESNLRTLASLSVRSPRVGTRGGQLPSGFANASGQSHRAPEGSVLHKSSLLCHLIRKVRTSGPPFTGRSIVLETRPRKRSACPLCSGLSGKILRNSNYGSRAPQLYTSTREMAPSISKFVRMLESQESGSMGQHIPPHRTSIYRGLPREPLSSQLSRLILPFLLQHLTVFPGSRICG